MDSDESGHDTEVRKYFLFMIRSAVAICLSAEEVGAYFLHETFSRLLATCIVHRFPVPFFCFRDGSSGMHSFMAG
jgi:hypothetical protein